MSRHTVLVIDDEKDVLELVRYNLEKEHIDVIVASDGESGLDIGLRHKPDLVLLDLMMPGMSGMEVCRRLRADDRTGDSQAEARASSAATAGSVLPSRNSRNAPPAVEM